MSSGEPNDQEAWKRHNDCSAKREMPMVGPATSRHRRANERTTACQQCLYPLSDVVEILAEASAYIKTLDTAEQMLQDVDCE